MIVERCKWWTRAGDPAPPLAAGGLLDAMSHADLQSYLVREIDFRDPRDDDWLEQELARAAQAMPFAMIEQLIALGVPRPWLAEMTWADALGRLRVVEAGARWRPAEDGEPGPPRLIVAVRDPAGRLIDLLAVSSVDPATWSLRTGDGVILGMDALADAEHAAASAAWRRDNRMAADAEAEAARTVRLFGRPIDLLAAGGRGICVLEWRAAALWTLRLLGPEVTLVADGAAEAARLAALLRDGALPQVKFQRGRGRMAA